MKSLKTIIPALLVLLATGCNGDSPNKPGNSERPLAGGGRLDNGDPFGGTSDSNGTSFPDIYPEDGVYPIYSAQIDCSNSPGERIIDNADAWKQWWDATTPCQWRGGWIDDDGTVDSNWVPGDSAQPCNGNCDVDPPYVDFEQYVVAAISVEYDSGAFCYRSVWVTDVKEVDGTTTVYYEVSKLDQTCCEMTLAMFAPTGFSPVEAVLIERPVNQIDWVRSNTTWDCPGPDPNEPMTLHYTDAPCALGNGEEIITDSAAWNDWFHTAWACDSARMGYWMWGGPDIWDSANGFPPGDSVKPWPVDSTIYNPYPWWGAPNVDFTTHAVIILRAGDQTQWGGGIWLTDIDRTSGTSFNYSVMQPSPECPPMEMMGMNSNPTVAIRVPLPIDPPVSWNRQIETIRCDWGADSSWTGIDPNGGRH